MQNEQTSLEDQLNSTEQKVSQLQQQKQEIEKNIQELDAQLGQAVQELTDLSGQEEAKQQEIQATNEQLAKAQQTERIQYENMKLRIRYMYEQGSANYLTVLLTSADASDLLSRAEYISSIYRYDRKMLDQYEKAKEAVETQQGVLAKEYQDLEQLRASAEEKKASVEQLVARKNQELQQSVQTLSATENLAQQYQEQIDYRESVIRQLEQAAQDASAQQNEAIASLAALNNANAALQAQAEEAAARAILEKMAEEEQAKLGSYDMIVDPNSLFVWPCPSSTRITSNYGYRVHPIYGDYRLHNGIDIGAETGSAIIAAYKGTVIGAGYNTSMGNYVMIDHGQGLVTIYMHASYLCVSEGEEVETGQLIALVGSTGAATGPHLHFTTRVNGNYVSPWNYVSK